MNYGHMFHAGNFADVFKHAVLARILTYLAEKPAPFRVIDTHAGEGLYDLSSQEANRTGEWRDGIGHLVAARLQAPAAELFEPYLAAVRACNPGGELRFYPGSPLLAYYLLRPQDRFVACEILDEAASALARNLRAAAAPADSGRSRAKVVPIDGWVALQAYVPPKERRGLVIVDPPYEQPDDFARLADGVLQAHRKWPTGIYLMWYPVKSREGPERLAAAIRGSAVEKALQLELTVAAAAPGLGACGIIVLNPPWRLAADLDVMLPVLVAILGRDAGCRSSMVGLAGEDRRHTRHARHTRRDHSGM